MDFSGGTPAGFVFDESPMVFECRKKHWIIGVDFDGLDRESKCPVIHYAQDLLSASEDCPDYKEGEAQS